MKINNLIIAKKAKDYANTWDVDNGVKKIIISAYTQGVEDCIKVINK